jgi:hypothetical protein
MREGVSQQLKRVAGKLKVVLMDASDVAAKPAETLDQP